MLLGPSASYNGRDNSISQSKGIIIRDDDIKYQGCLNSLQFIIDEIKLYTAQLESQEHDINEKIKALNIGCLVGILIQSIMIFVAYITNVNVIPSIVIMLMYIFGCFLYKNHLNKYKKKISDLNKLLLQSEYCKSIVLPSNIDNTPYCISEVESIRRDFNHITKNIILTKPALMVRVFTDTYKDPLEMEFDKLEKQVEADERERALALEVQEEEQKRKKFFEISKETAKFTSQF